MNIFEIGRHFNAKIRKETSFNFGLKIYASAQLFSSIQFIINYIKL